MNAATVTLVALAAAILAVASGAPFNPLTALLEIPRDILNIPANTINDFTGIITDPAHAAIEIPEKFLSRAVADALTMVLVAPLPAPLQAAVIIFLKCLSMIIHAVFEAMKTPLPETSTTS